MSEPSIVTIPDVPIVSTGTWLLSSGLATFTSDDLADAVAAAQEPGFSTPRAKPGHSDEVFVCPSCPGVCECGAAPALGYYTNLRLTADGQTIIADHVVRSDIAATLPSDYPSRSFEGYFDVKSPTTGRDYRLVVTAVALLGVAPPAIAWLPDLDADAASNALAASSGRSFRTITATGGSVSRQLTAQVTQEDIRRAFDAQVGWPEDLWIRTWRRDPDDVIAETWEGGDVFRIPYTINGEDIEFGEPVPQVYADASGATVAATSGRLAATYSRPERRPGTNPDEETQTMTASAAVLTRLGLPEGATEDEILAKLEEAGIAPAADSGSEDDTAHDDETTEVDAPAASEQPLAAVLSPDLQAQLKAAGLSLVSDDQLEQIKAQAEDGKAAREQQVAERMEACRKRVVGDKITAAQWTEHFQKLHASDPDGTEALLASMPSGILPTTQQSSGNTASDDPVPAEQRERLAAFRGKSTTTKEG